MKIENKKNELRIQILKNLKRFLEPSCLKKAELRIQEMAFMLLAVFLFFVLIGLFILTIVYTNIHDTASQIAEDRTLSSLTSLADTPEMSCVGSKSNCIDGDKLINLVGKDIYGEFWPYSSLKVIKFSGFNKNEKEIIECKKENYPECDVFYIYDKKVKNERAISSFATMCRKEFENDYTYDKCEIVKIIAGTKLVNENEKQN